MRFDQDKERTIKKMLSNDKSNKGSVDKRIKKLLEKINRLDDFYTTSSCSGRIIIIGIPKSGRKKEAEFLYRTHDLMKYNSKLISVIKESLNYKESVWFRQEPVILHVAARTLEHASEFLRTARKIGFKRSGLFEVDKRFLMELVSTERIDTIIAKDGKLLVSNDYFKVLSKEANKRLENTWEKIKKLEENIDTISTV